jgi:hypothetical protein
MITGNSHSISRRKFLKLAGLAAGAALLSACDLRPLDIAQGNSPTLAPVPRRAITLDPLPTLTPTATPLSTPTPTSEPVALIEKQLGDLIGPMGAEWRINKDSIGGVIKLGVDALSHPSQSVTQWYAPNENRPAPSPFSPDWKNVFKVNKDGSISIKPVDYYSSYHAQANITLSLADIQYNANLATLVVYDQDRNFRYRYNQVVNSWVDNRLQAGLPVNIDVSRIREVIPWVNPELLLGDAALDFIAKFNQQMAAQERAYIAASRMPVGNYDVVDGPLSVTFDTLPFPITRLMDEPKVSVVYCPPFGPDDHDKYIWGMVKNQATTDPVHDAILWHYVTIDNTSFAWYSLYGEQKRFRENLSARANLKQLMTNPLNKSSVTFFIHGSSQSENWNKAIAEDKSKGWSWFLELFDRYTAAKIDVYALFNAIFADLTETDEQKTAYSTFIQDKCLLPALDTGTDLYQ